MVRWPIALIALTVLVLAPGAAHAEVISGSVTDTNGVALGANVVVAGPNQVPIVGNTDGSGNFSVSTTGARPFSVAVSAPGYASQSVRDASGALPPFALKRSVFIPLPVFAGASFSVAADPTSGIFFTPMNQAPEVYRSLDHGGSWQPAVMAYDDPDTGLDRRGGSDSLVSTGVSGELAIASRGGDPAFSTDYGLTWRKIGGDRLGNPHVPNVAEFLYWGHAARGAPSVLVLAQTREDGSWEVLRANMDAAEPALTRMSGDPFGVGSVLHGADSRGGSFVGRVTAGGELGFAPLGADGTLDFAAQRTGLPTPPRMLRLGGSRRDGAPPDGALVVSGSAEPFSALMLTKSADSFGGASASSATALDVGCRFNQGAFSFPTGSVAPTTTGDSGAGNAGQCWIEKTGSDQPLTQTMTCCEAFDFTYDAGFGQPGNNVILRAGGPVSKAAAFQGGAPFFNQFGPAQSGTGSDTGGNSESGMASLAVGDTAYGPGGESDFAAATGRGAIARRAGIPFTWVSALRLGSGDVQWWNGASGEWLVFTQGPGGKQLLAFLNWRGEVAADSNVTGSEVEYLGGPKDAFATTAIQGVPGSDTIFIGSGVAHTGIAEEDNHLFRGTLVPGNPPRLENLFDFDSVRGGVTLYLPQSLAYCPAGTMMPDTLFVATGDGGGDVAADQTKGSLLRITGATSPSPSVAQVESVPHGTPGTSLANVRADCARNLVYTAGGGRIYRSEDGGLTFVGLVGPPGGPELGGPQSIGLDPANGDNVTVGTNAGMVWRSNDGGGNWEPVNDPELHRNVWIHDIEVLPGGGAVVPGLTARAAAVSPLALVGTAAGVFQADVTAGNGLIGMSPFSSGSPALVSRRITEGASDGTPALAGSGADSHLAVFVRPDGLGETKQTGGKWSPAAALPGTAKGDIEPVLVRGTPGTLHLVFRRSLGARGIYYMKRSGGGAWSAPQRLSRGVADRQPSLAILGRTANVAFLRQRRPKPGVYFATDRGGRWRTVRLRGTGSADARASLGGPSLATGTKRRLHLVFPRAGRKGGLHYLERNARRKWGKPARITRRRGDLDPLLVVDARGRRQLLLRRAGGLVFGQAGRRWKFALIPGTAAGDTQASLALTGATLRLVFTRPGGDKPGIYFQERTGGRWLSAPVRRSGTKADANPALATDGGGRIAIVYERG